jgi:GH25 family lysozyme M1 (1,4-beta-N-acetylmuramidase)
MVYLNILIGFSFIMLVFAIGVSIAQAMLTRLLSLKGKAVVGHLLEKLRELWAQTDLPAEAYPEVAAALTTQLTTRRYKHALTLHASTVGNQQVAAAILRRFGKEQLPGLVGWVRGAVDIAGSWEWMVQGIEHDWHSIAPMVSTSYTGNTKRYLLGLSAVAVLLFNVDAIRILRVLAVDPNVRDALVTDAARAVAPQPAQTSGAANAPDARTVSDSSAQLTSWQKQNVAELKATGLPLGWELTPLWVCQDGATAMYQKPCSGEISPWDTVLLWLMSLLGLVLGTGLVSQGAPFWFSLLQRELGLKSAAGQLAATTTTATTTTATATTATTATATASPPQPGQAAEPSQGPAPTSSPGAALATGGAPATGPVLITDIYSGDGTPTWAAFMASSTFSGVILKATDGVSFSAAKSWFVPQWQAARSAAGASYRRTVFLGAYHWLEFYDNPEQQADYYCSILEQVGWGAGDMLPIVDVEFGSDGAKPAPNYQASVDRNAQLVIDCTSRYAARIKRNLGSDTRVVLYSGQVLKELQISDHMGCDYLWMAQYGVSKPDLDKFYSLGWTDQQIVMWQYTDGGTGSNKTKSPQLPDDVPGMGPRDCSVFRDGDLALFRSMLIKR